MNDATPKNAPPEHTAAVVSQSPADADVPGVQVEYSAAEAEQNGAFKETAMSERDAWESNAMLDPNNTAIVVGGKRVSAGSGKATTKGN
jgi:type IV secretion system protein VirB1